MEEQKDILELADIKVLVDSFYRKVRGDDLLGDIFNKVIQDRWDQHLEKMHRFWQTVLLKEHTYYGAPFSPHAQLPVKAIHFERWKALFNETVDELFMGDKAEEAKWRGAKMAEMFLMKINYYQNQNKSARPLL
ncbi:MAG: group III truncated hemoglobin [Saprospiraceae bacterium]|nr:group III truncated hemoglobin [Saprospiraceae bacterium]